MVRRRACVQTAYLLWCKKCSAGSVTKGLPKSRGDLQLLGSYTQASLLEMSLEDEEDEESLEGLSGQRALHRQKYEFTGWAQM